MSRQEVFVAFRSEGALLPVDLVRRIVERDGAVPGISPEAYHLSGETLNEAINRSWNRLLGAWSAFGKAREKATPADAGTSITRERWLLVLFQELGYGRLVLASTVSVAGKPYAVSHLWANIPIHLVGSGVVLDTRTPGIAGAARSSPHSLVQELLNRRPESQWGFVSNGLRLRILRDSASLTRQAYVEFDLETIFDNELFTEFVPVWLLCHQSRIESIAGGSGPRDCWLERWVAFASTHGTRVLDDLRQGVENAISTLGNGFLSHPTNRDMREALRSGALTPLDYYRQLLRLVYRLIFLFVTEDRGLLHDPTASVEQRELYARHYSTARLRDLAEHVRGGRHVDVYEALKTVMRGLGTADGVPALGLPGFGGFLWSSETIGELSRAQIANRDLLDAVRALSFTDAEPRRRPIDFRNLGTEELGSVYESLLELHPSLNTSAPSFSLGVVSGHERRTTGSYYTPTSLIDLLLDSALEPVLDERLQKKDGREAEEALLSIRVIDPAAGSGHFLVAAAHRMAKRLASIRTGDSEPGPEAMPAALRDVIAHCIYAVDVNEMAVELCRVALWLESVEPGRPLSFLDAHIRCGNSLVGVTPALLVRGIPNEAFEAASDDDNRAVRELRDRNRREREGQLAFDERDIASAGWEQLEREAAEIEHLPERSFEDVVAKQARYAELLASPSYEVSRAVADAWCAAFTMSKGTAAQSQITTGTLRRLAAGLERVSTAERDAIAAERRSFAFFHWYLEFPDVFAVGSADEPPGWQGGFDVVLGNPPWERVEFEEREFFASRRADIASAAGTKRKAMIAQLEREDPALFADYMHAARHSEAENHFTRRSGRFPLSARGRLNTYALFVETMRAIQRDSGRLGAVVPTGVATDDSTKELFGALQSGLLVSLYDFENLRGIFPSVHRSYKFSLLTVRGRATAPGPAHFAFFLHSPDELHDVGRRFVLSEQDFALLNPNTRTCPTFRTTRDADLTKAIYHRIGAWVRLADGNHGNPWQVWFLQGLFHMSGDSSLFFELQPAHAVPLYEAKMIHQYNHRYAGFGGRKSDNTTQLPPSTQEQLADSSYSLIPRYWVETAEVERRLERWPHQWLIGYRMIARATDERTIIASALPRVGAGHSLALVFSSAEPSTLACLLGNLNALILDYVARQKVAGVNTSFFIMNQLPIVPPQRYAEFAQWDGTLRLSDWISSRVMELSYTSHHLTPFARDLGLVRGPFLWDVERRRQVRAELDAAFLHIYGLNRTEADYVLSTFEVLRNAEQREFGRFLTRDLVLREYDRLSGAAALV